VAGPLCPHCGAALVPGAAFCASCGAPVTPGPTGGAPAAAPLASFPAPFAPPGPYPPGFSAAPGPTPSSRNTDAAALSSVIVAAVVSLVATAVSVATLFLPSTGQVEKINTSGSTPTVTIPLLAVQELALTAGIGLVLALLYFWYYRRAFQTLAPVDARFSTPGKLTLLALIALVLIAAVGAGILVLVYQAIQCAGPSDVITSACVSFRALAGLVLLLAVFAILALVGFIGFLIGIWRLGTRYGESTFKVGAVLMIIPLLNIVGVILVLVAARSARARLGSPAGMPSFG
jgi:hypothetical protein